MEDASWVREISHPAGFVVPASAGPEAELRAAILAAYHRLGRGWVVVRSPENGSIDLTEVKGDDALIDAVLHRRPGEVVVTATTRILVPTDFSRCSEAAVRFAAEMARPLSGAIDLLHVRGLPNLLPFSPPAVSLMEMELRDQVAREHAEVLLDGYLDRLGDEGQHRARALQTVGNAADEIIACASIGRYDFIVMGTHGRGAVKRFFIGSVAAQVIRKAPCPVITVHEEADHPSHAEADSSRTQSST